MSEIPAQTQYGSVYFDFHNETNASVSSRSYLAGDHPLTADGKPCALSARLTAGPSGIWRVEHLHLSQQIGDGINCEASPELTAQMTHEIETVANIVCHEPAAKLSIARSNLKSAQSDEQQIDHDISMMEMSIEGCEGEEYNDPVRAEQLRDAVTERTKELDRAKERTRDCEAAVRSLEDQIQAKAETEQARADGILPAGDDELAAADEALADAMLALEAARGAINRLRNL
jgi:chromosome segregation ATPase